MTHSHYGVLAETMNVEWVPSTQAPFAAGELSMFRVPLRAPKPEDLAKHRTSSGHVLTVSITPVSAAVIRVRLCEVQCW